MIRVAIAGALIASLAGCGTPPPDATKDGNSVTAATGNGAACDHPDFAPLYSDAKVSTCEGGTVIYTTAATPAAILAWTRDQAGKSGLKVDLVTDMNLSATEGSRKLMVMAMPEGTGSTVTINWSK